MTIALAATAATPALAGNEGSVGVEDDIVVVGARESLPGHNAVGVADPECVWSVVIDDDVVGAGVYSFDGERLYSDTGRWLQKDCGEGPIEVNGFFVIPENGGFDVPDLLDQAIDALDPRPPTWSASPDGISVAMVTQMPVLLWVDPGYWGSTFMVRVETPSGRVWAEATAMPVSTTWHPGDGTVLDCSGGGIPFAGFETATDCSHVYTHSSSTQGEMSMTVTVTFEVWATTSLDPTPRLVGSISRSSTPVSVLVGEIQAIETAGGM